MSIIVDINHETGNLSQYTSLVGGTALSVTGTAALANTKYGMAVNVSDFNDHYGRKFKVAITKTVRARFYVNPNGLTMDVNTYFEILQLWSGSFLVASVSLKWFGGSYRIFGTAYADTFTVSTLDVPISNQSHCIEIYIQGSSGINNDGFLYLYVDGALKEVLSSLDNDTKFFSFAVARLGKVGGLGMSITGIFYLDELIVNDNGWEIGPIDPMAQADMVLSDTIVDDVLLDDVLQSDIVIEDT